jgi:energy-coupling factor transporter ATP-binding protein EcfA2
VNASVLGLSKKETDAKLEEIIDFAEIGEFIDTPVQNYSSGMAVRLGFAVASSLDPDILLVDEVLAVGDTAFQRKCLQKMMKYVDQGGSTILVAHNMHLIQSVCSRGIFLDHGQIEVAGTETKAIAAYHRKQDAINAGERTPSGEIQPGEKRPVVIRKVTVSGLGGEEIVEGGGITICLEYEAVRAGIEVNWGLSVWSSDQLLRLFTCTDRYDASRAILQMRGRVSCEIKDWMLVGGRYALKVGVYDYKSSWPIHRIGWEDAPVFFEVKPVIREIAGRRLADGDLIAVASNWQYLPQPCSNE